MEETELISRLKNGDYSAFRLIFDQYHPSILNCCFRFVKSKETAEDLTQEVLIEVYKSINTFRAESKFSTWLYRIAISKSLDHLKSLKRQKRRVFLKSIFSNTEADERDFSSDGQNPQRLLENAERVQVLSDAVSSLSDNQNVAFTLSKYDELSYQEIAEILGTTIPSVESLIFRAKSNLKKKLYNYYKTHQ